MRREDDAARVGHAERVARRVEVGLVDESVRERAIHERDHEALAQLLAMVDQHVDVVLDRPDEQQGASGELVREREQVADHRLGVVELPRRSHVHDARMGGLPQGDPAECQTAHAEGLVEAARNVVGAHAGAQQDGNEVVVSVGHRRPWTSLFAASAHVRMRYVKGLTGTSHAGSTGVVWSANWSLNWRTPINCGALAEPTPIMS